MNISFLSFGFFYKSLIMHDGESLDCWHYFSDVFDTNTGIWSHCDDDNTTQISDILEWFYIRDILKTCVSLKRYIFCGLYQNKIFDIIQIWFFQEWSNMSKIHHMKKVLEYLDVFKKYFRAIQDVSDEIKQLVLLLKTSFKILLKLIHPVKNTRGCFGWIGIDWNVFY